MAYAKLEPSGCGIHKSRVQLRIDMFLEPANPYYERYHIYVPVFPPDGYSGKVDKEGTPENQADYDTWEASLPHIWQDKSFHSHFIYPSLDADDNSIKAKMERVLDYFYCFHKYCWDNDKKFIDEWTKVPSKVGEVRCPFIKGDVKDFEASQLKVQDIINRITEFQLAKSIILPTGLSIGEKGTIDVGVEAINRLGNEKLSNTAPSYETLVNYNNAANATGSIDTVDFYAYTTEAGNSLKVGSFIDNGSGSFTCHDSQVCGQCTNGINQFTSLAIDIDSGEYIGATGATPYQLYVDKATSGFAGLYEVVGQYCEPLDETTYTLGTGDCISLYGTGEEAGTTVTPTTLALTLTEYAPILREVLTPTTLSLTTTTYVPVLKEVTTPSTLSLTTTGYAPILKEVTTPTTLSLALTSYAPILKEVLTPSTLSLSTTGYAPVLREVLTPTTLSIILTAYAPVLNSSIVIGLLELVLTGYAPTLGEEEIAFRHAWGIIFG